MPVYELEGVRPKLGRDVYVAPGARVIGNVTAGESSSFWFGSVTRGDLGAIVVGARTNVQDNAILHLTGGISTTTIGDDVTIGHAAIVHGCTIGDLCLIGIGAIVLDDVVIETECLVAAGSLVPPRMKIPRRSFVVGHPAKVQRTLTDLELDQIRLAAAHYVHNARTFAATCVVVDRDGLSGPPEPQQA